MFNNDLGRCSTCRFFDGLRAIKDREGECRKLAPRSTIGLVDPGAGYSSPQVAAFPIVRGSDGCGEHEPSMEGR